MALSLDGITSALDTGSSRANSIAADSLKNSAKKLSSESSEEELKGVLRDFESYFVEQVIKQVKDTFTGINEKEDSVASRYTDFFMDTAIEQIADQLLDEVGTGLTEQLYEQMKRNYNIEG